MSKKHFYLSFGSERETGVSDSDIIVLKERLRIAGISMYPDKNASRMYKLYFDPSDQVIDRKLKNLNRGAGRKKKSFLKEDGSVLTCGDVYQKCGPYDLQSQKRSTSFSSFSRIHGIAVSTFYDHLRKHCKNNEYHPESNTAF